MSKEYLEAFYCILNNDYDSDERYKLAVNNVEDGLKRLEAIDNAKPSEALELVGYLKDHHLNAIPYYYWLNDIEKYILKSQEQEKVLNELIKLVKDLEPTFNRKGVSSDTDILGTIIKDYFYDNASDLLKRYFK